MKSLFPSGLLALGSLAAMVCVAALASVCPAGDPEDSQREIQKLIAQLGSDNFEVREAAARRLMESEDAIPALRKASEARDAEVARRARDILDSFARKEKGRAFARLADLAKEGAIDLAVERFVRREKWDNESECWQVLADLAGKLGDLEQKSYDKSSLRTVKVTRDEFPLVASTHRLRIVAARNAVEEFWKDRVVLRAEEIPTGYELSAGIFALSGTAKLKKVTAAIVFAGGAMEVEQASGSVIVCDGEFKGGGHVVNSLVIASGTIWCPLSVRDSHLISCGTIEKTRRVSDSKLVPNEPKPLGFVKFFDPADVGIKVELERNAVRVKEATKGKRFAAAGLRTDDVVMALNGDEVKDVDGFRRLLRAKIAVDAELILKVKRGEKTVEVRVSPKG